MKLTLEDPEVNGKQLKIYKNRNMLVAPYPLIR
jgi:hypothetical protein